MIKRFLWLVLLALSLATLPALAQTTTTATSVETSASAAPTAAPRIGIMTMKPGNIFWERFGHDAIVVVDPKTGESLNYNFGFFDPAAPDFVSRFARGEMRYQLAVLRTADDLSIYRTEGRGASIQWLNLTPQEAIDMDRALRLNAQPENAFYDYRYFTDNCATRVRDALNLAVGGELKSQLQSRSQGLTYRSEAIRLADNAHWMRYLFDLGLGPKADTPMSMWDAGFVPGRLATSLTDFKRANGEPLVQNTEPVLEHQLRPDAVDPYFNWVVWLVAGIFVGLAYLWLAKRYRRASSILLTLTWLKFALFGLVLTYLWAFTAHDFAYANRNLYILSPLALIPLLFYWRRNPRLLQLSAAVVHVALPVIGLFDKWMFDPQQNAHWLALLVPVHFAIYLALAEIKWRNESSEPPRAE